MFFLTLSPIRCILSLIIIIMRNRNITFLCRSIWSCLHYFFHDSLRCLHHLKRFVLCVLLVFQISTFYFSLQYCFINSVFKVLFKETRRFIHPSNKPYLKCISPWRVGSTTWFTNTDTTWDALVYLSFCTFKIYFV